VKKKFTLWNSKNVFKISWIILVNVYAEFKVDFEDIFIDASHIKNYYGADLIGKVESKAQLLQMKLVTIVL